MRKINWLVLVFPLLVACTGSNNKLQKEIADSQTTVEADTTKSGPSSFYFNGDFIYLADAASLKDCATGSVFPIAMKGAYREVERKYKELDPEPLEAINCEVMGYLADKPKDEEGPDKQLVITGLVGFDRSITCSNADNLTDGTYIYYEPNEENVQTITKLNLDNDYTFSCAVYKYEPAELISKTSGHWHRMAKDNIVFLVDGDVLYEGNIDFNNMNFLLQNDNEKEVVFEKRQLLK